MSHLSRLARRAISTTHLSTHLRRPFAAKAAASAPSSKPKLPISESADRVKSDYIGQRQRIQVDLWKLLRWKGDYRDDGRLIPVGRCNWIFLPHQWGPKRALDSYVSHNAVLAKQVTVWDGASVWKDAVLRGEIRVGFCSNVQERCVIHAAWASPTGLPAQTMIDRFVTVGAYSLLKSCTIEPKCIIGQHSILMEGSLMETHSILEAGSVVPPGQRIPSGELWAGNPARFVRALSHEETLEIPELAIAINDLSNGLQYQEYSTVYLKVEKRMKSLGISI